jgi:hypothetical protein
MFTESCPVSWQVSGLPVPKIGPRNLLILNAWNCGKGETGQNHRRSKGVEPGTSRRKVMCGSRKSRLPFSRAIRLAEPAFNRGLRPHSQALNSGTARTWLWRVSGVSRTGGALSASARQDKSGPHAGQIVSGQNGI